MGYDQTKPSNSLGLSLVKRLVTRQLSGDISIDSTGGTTVTINWKSYE